jgi:hypothetical protein
MLEAVNLFVVGFDRHIAGGCSLSSGQLLRASVVLFHHNTLIHSKE